ncbi:MAG: hypothetical protein IKD47_02315 [Clostridia bacterium]|nr:hypothetical protein [Clostridia bacterium]
MKKKFLILCLVISALTAGLAFGGCGVFDEESEKSSVVSSSENSVSIETSVDISSETSETTSEGTSEDTSVETSSESTSQGPSWEDEDIKDVEHSEIELPEVERP